ncbi:MAG: hypothetical protein KDK36_12005, partial [Leptospiraceae bacterium]|nr:hypothetical protein [Leptospiraceae bacterium]
LLSGLISVNPVLKREKVINSLLKFGLIFAIPISIFILFSSSLLNLFNIKMEPYYVPGYRTKGFYEIAKKVENLKKEIDPDAIVIANRYQDAAILSWYLEGQPFVKSFNIMQKNQYNLWSSPSKGKNYLLVHIQENTCEKSFVFFQPYLELMFDSIREFPEEDITYDGATIKRYQVWYLQNYKKEWSTGLQNYLREDYLNVLLPSLTLNKEIKVDKDLFQKGVNMMSSYHNRAGEVDCKIFK